MRMPVFWVACLTPLLVRGASEENWVIKLWQKADPERRYDESPERFDVLSPPPSKAVVGSDRCPNDWADLCMISMDHSLGHSYQKGQIDPTVGPPTVHIA